MYIQKRIAYVELINVALKATVLKYSGFLQNGAANCSLRAHRLLFLSADLHRRSIRATRRYRKSPRK